MREKGSGGGGDVRVEKERVVGKSGEVGGSRREAGRDDIHFYLLPIQELLVDQVALK